MSKEEIETLQMVVDGLTGLIEKDKEQIRKYLTRIRCSKIEREILIERINMELNKNA